MISGNASAFHIEERAFFPSTEVHSIKLLEDMHQGYF